MSALAPLRRPTALHTPTGVPAQRKPAALPRPRLVLVSPQRTTAGRLPFLILVGAVLVVGLVGVLLLHMIAAQDGFRATALQKQLTTLTGQEQLIAKQVEADSAPIALQRRAAALSMVATTVTSIHRLHDGRAVGTQTPVYAPPPPQPVTKPTKSAKTTKTKTANSTKATSTKTTKSTKTTSAKTTKTGMTNPPKHHAGRPTHP